MANKRYLDTRAILTKACQELNATLKDIPGSPDRTRVTGYRRECQEAIRWANQGIRYEISKLMGTFSRVEKRMREKDPDLYARKTRAR